MNECTIVCLRCRGRKKLYKVRSIYSYTNTGGILVNCPMCCGVGKVKPIEQVINDVKNKKSKKLGNGDKSDGKKED